MIVQEGVLQNWAHLGSPHRAVKHCTELCGTCTFDLKSGLSTKISGLSRILNALGKYHTCLVTWMERRKFTGGNSYNNNLVE